VLVQRASDACSVTIWKAMRAIDVHRMGPDLARCRLKKVAQSAAIRF